MSGTTTLPVTQVEALDALRTVSELCQRYEITALDDFLASCRTFAREETLNIAILGRFKGGKSSFLNHLLDTKWLPAGAVPVTAVVTEIEYGPLERAEVVFKDGSRRQIALNRISEFVSESENPENSKQALRVRVELPSTQRYRGTRFVDTPGLESILKHNTEASIDWLPNVGLALVAVGIDSPLSQRDIELIGNLSRYTPDISVLLTKVDIVDESDRAKVADFVRKQLARYCNKPVPVFSYSIRPGFEHLRVEIERLLSRVDAQASEHRAAVLRHKIDSLLGECCDYLTLALRVAETDDSERQRLRQSIVDQEHLDDTRQALRLLVRHAAATSRTAFERLLQPDEGPVRHRLLIQFDREFSLWTHSLRVATERFDEWLSAAVFLEMAGLSSKHREAFLQPIERASRQLSQSLQDFRNRLSERTLQALGVPLRTSEMELHVEDPRSPDVRLGKIFDRNWELLSFLLPMPLVKGLLKKHFQKKVADVVFMNLSRLASQWEGIVNASLSTLEKEALHRLDVLIATIDKLTATAGQETSRIRADQLRLAALRRRLNGDARSS
jgi:GTP-binding protein EngB required for normal cell division